MSGVVCVRCGEEIFGLVRTDDDIHVCKDIAKRLARRERQVGAVENLLRARRLGWLDAPVTDRQVAESIVKALAGLGVADD